MKEIQELNEKFDVLMQEMFELRRLITNRKTPLIKSTEAAPRFKMTSRKWNEVFVNTGRILPAQGSKRKYCRKEVDNLFVAWERGTITI